MIHEHEREQSRLSWWCEVWPGLLLIILIAFAVVGAVQLGQWAAHVL